MLQQSLGFRCKHGYFLFDVFSHSHGLLLGTIILRAFCLYLPVDLNWSAVSFFPHRYAEASASEATLLGSTDLLLAGGANVFVRNYLICRTCLFLYMWVELCSSFASSISISVALSCNNDFEGGGWALVRRVKKGSTWYAANDNLRGTARYGIENSRITDNSAFSIPYSTNLWIGTEFLFMMGNHSV